MTQFFALVGASCKATGHPSDCTEPAPGTVESTGTASITVNGSNVYTKQTGDIVVPDHAHDYRDTNDDDSKECTDVQSHTVDPDDTRSITYNGTPVYRVGDSTTDPTSGGTITITQNP